MSTRLTEILKANRLQSTVELEELNSQVLRAEVILKSAKLNFENKLEQLKRDRPITERLIYSAYDRCQCGAGLAYDTSGESGQPFGGYWQCSSILLGIADFSVQHNGNLPFIFYSVKGEGQPSANGSTTRPPIDD